jgi:hypothetical protein
VAFLVSSMVLWCIGVATTLVYHRRLRSFYPEVAARIAPGLLRKSIASDLAGIRFLLLREYRSFDRRAFVRFCDFHRVILAAFTLAFSGFIVCLVCGGFRS